MNVVAISVTAISSRSPNMNTNFFPLLPQFVNGSGVKEAIVNEQKRAKDGGLPF